MKGSLAILSCHSASAGPWSIEPQLGISTDYSTNPELRYVDPVAEHHVAGIFTIPIYYDVDALHVAVTPSGRITDSEGYSSLASNYTRVNANASYSTELDIFSLQAGLSRDTSLYDTGQIAYGYGVGVRRDSALTGANWTHLITERTQVEVDTGYSRVSYAQPANSTNLVDYDYVSANPTLTYALSERNSLKLLSGFGHYAALNGETQSNSTNLQVGFNRLLSEIWTLSANVGYSRSTTREKLFLGEFYLGSIDSDQDGTVYGANLTRTGEQFNFSAAASRSLQPFGSYGLSQQESYGTSTSYTLSELWSFSATVGWVKELDPTQTGGDISVHYLNAQFNVSWHASPQWIVSAHATEYSRKFGTELSGVQSSGVGIDVVRQFLRSEL